MAIVQIIAVLVLLIVVGFSCYQSGYDAGLLAGG